MKTIKGDLLAVTYGIICHQVNCQRVMGAGLALQIRKKYPKHYEDYMYAPQRLGSVCVTHVRPNLYVAGIFGQYGYGRTGIHTAYEALEQGLVQVAALARKKRLPVYLPYGIGCGLAGGDWNKVSDIIRRTNPNAIVVCR